MQKIMKAVYYFVFLSTFPLVIFSIFVFLFNIALQTIMTVDPNENPSNYQLHVLIWLLSPVSL